MKPTPIKIFLMLCCLFPIANGFAQTEIPLYAKEIPNSTATANAEKRVLRADGVDWVSDVSVPTLLYYPAKKSSKTSASVLICPGGGYAGLSIVGEGIAVAQEFNKHGISAFVLKYRMPSNKTMIDRSIGPLQDAQTAIAMIRSNAKKWNIDSTKIGIIGFSAGGHVASSAGTHFLQPVIATQGISCRPDFMILLYPVISMKDSLTHKGSRNALIGSPATKEQILLFSNEVQITNDTPPTFIVHAGDDKVVSVENSIAFYQALQKKKINTQLMIYPKGGHGFGLDNPTTKDKWIDHCLLWLNENVMNLKP